MTSRCIDFLTARTIHEIDDSLQSRMVSIGGESCLRVCQAIGLAQKMRVRLDLKLDHPDLRLLGDRHELCFPDTVHKGGLDDERDTTADQEVDNLEEQRVGPLCQLIAGR